MSRFEKDESFDLNSYVKVNERLAAFREKYPEGCIVTERRSEDDGVAFVTSVYRNTEEAAKLAGLGVSASTGHAYLEFDQAGTKSEEFTETVSLGRALANLGFSVEKSIASREEMENFYETSSYESDEEEEFDEDLEEQEEEPKLRASRKFNGSKKKSRFTRNQARK